jgi:hypothetical protein
MEQSPSWETNRSSASQKILLNLRKPAVHYCLHNSPQHIPIPSQLSPVHASPFRFLKTGFNIFIKVVVPSNSGSSCWSKMCPKRQKLVAKRHGVTPQKTWTFSDYASLLWIKLFPCLLNLAHLFLPVDLWKHLTVKLLAFVVSNTNLPSASLLESHWRLWYRNFFGFKTLV